MNSFKLFCFLSAFLIINQACSDTETDANVNPFAEAEKTEMAYTTDQYNNTKGYWENGELITHFYCPDAKGTFPPIDLKSWDKTPAINGRLPTYEETTNGTAIHHYGEKENVFVKPYYLKLPKLARYIGPSSVSVNGPMKNELVVVIQIAQTPKDTIVGYRFLTGGVGGSTISDYHFLTDDEVKEAVNP